MKGNKGPFERKNKGFEHSGTLLAHTRKVFFSVIVLKGLLARQSNRKLLLLPIFVLLIR